MQIKGNEFLKNVQKKQEREELEKRLQELKASNENSYIEDEPQTIKQNAPFIQPESVINPYQNSFEQNLQSNPNLNSQHELDNIMLGASAFSNEDNKKKYIMLGVVLVVLFLLTIIIIRLLTSDSSSKEDSFTSNGAKTSESKSLSNNNIEENFQKIINERAKKDNEQMIDPSRLSAEERLNNIQTTQETTQQVEQTKQTTTEQESISNETIDNAMKKVEEQKAAKQQMQNVQQTKSEIIKKEPVAQKTETKKSVKDLVVENSSNSTSNSAPSDGYFVQVGAFTKKPADSFINKIRSGNLKYKIYQHEVNGVLYNKVLIGPYPTKDAATKNVGNIKTTLDVANAHVVKF